MFTFIQKWIFILLSAIFILFFGCIMIMLRLFNRKVVPILFCAFILVACVNRDETFYFDSNITLNVTANWGYPSQGCHTPCQLELQTGDHVSVYLNSHNDKFHIYGYDSSGNIIATWDSPYAEVVLGKLGGMDGVLLSSPPTITTAAVLMPFAYTSEATRATYRSLQAIHYDTYSYYIYVQDAATTYVFGENDFVAYALKNFEPMRSELFATEQPYIAAFTELTDLANIADILLASDSAVEFLDKLTMAKITAIWNDETLSKREKIADVAKFLRYDEWRIARIEANGPTIIDDMAEQKIDRNPSFLRDIEEYLQAHSIDITDDFER
ncbi:MAG: hypothetical protein LBV04_05635 [Deferribacteraceae bacterium]|jgi:hypothetical protein|nr:hypothetical protein [Deferribacteraceae bacterium]